MITAEYLESVEDGLIHDSYNQDHSEEMFDNLFGLGKKARERRKERKADKREFKLAKMGMRMDNKADRRFNRTSRAYGRQDVKKTAYRTGFDPNASTMGMIKHGLTVGGTVATAAIGGNVAKNMSSDSVEKARIGAGNPTIRKTPGGSLSTPLPSVKTKNIDPTKKDEKGGFGSFLLGLLGID